MIKNKKVFGLLAQSAAAAQMLGRVNTRAYRSHNFEQRSKSSYPGMFKMSMALGMLAMGGYLYQ